MYIPMFIAATAVTFYLCRKNQIDLIIVTKSVFNTLFDAFFRIWFMTGSFSTYYTEADKK